MTKNIDKLLKKKKLPSVDLFTDGACSGNPGPGGWGVLLRYNGTEKELSGAERETTNNRMELIAAIEGLSALKRRCQVKIYTDSTYVKKGVTEWMENWKQNGWQTAAKKPVKNDDLWKRLDETVGEHETQWIWVKGHAGHIENERVDKLARDAIAGLL